MNKLHWKFILFLSFISLLLAPNQFSAQTDPIYKNKGAAIEQKTTELEGKPGTYQVYLKYRKEDQVIEESIYITVFGENTSVKDQIAINANPAAVAQDQIGELSAKDWISLTGAKAWNTKTGEEVSVTEVNTDQLSNQLGTYPVTFSTVNQAEVTTSVEVVLNKVAQENINYYYKNKFQGSFENKDANGKISWFNFENRIVVFMQFVFILLLFIPIIALLAQYIFTRKLVEQVVKLIIK